MKKILMIGVILATIVACGTPKIKITPSDEKNILLNKIVNDKDQKAQQEYDEIITQLKLAMKKGNVDAKKEYDEWEELFEFKRFLL